MSEGGVLEFVLTGEHALTVATWALVFVSLAMCWAISVQVRNDPHVPHRIIGAITAACRWCREFIRGKAPDD